MRRLFGGQNRKVSMEEKTMVKQLTKDEYEQTEWWKDTVAWIAKIPEELDSKKPVPMEGWKVFEADTWSAARDAAASAAGAEWAAAWYAARVARNAAGAVAWSAARDAAASAAGSVAGAEWDVARDAALLVRIKICAGLDIDKKHVKHAEERWEANKRGFRVWGDLNGVLYVYRKK
jgi:hypothetical protein